MIRANRQLTTDRKLFKNIQKQCHILQFDCEPHQTTILDNLTEQIFLQVQTTLVSQLQQLDRKIESLSNQLHRLDAIMKFKKQKKLFSFANSPNSKTYSKLPESAEKYKQSWRSLNQQFNSTEPKTKQKQKYEVSNFDSDNKYNYQKDEIINLRRQILQLKKQLFRMHRWDDQNIDEANQIKSSGVKNRTQENAQIRRRSIQLFKDDQNNPNQQTKIKQFKDYQLFQMPNFKLQQNQIGQRYKAIIAQYQKQQQILRPMATKAQKYKNGLQIILQWLKKFKQEQLQKFLPCEACEMKKVLYQYFEKSQNIPLRKQSSYSSQKLKQIQNPVFQFSSSVAVDQSLDDQDSLLMQYDRNQMDDSQG